MEISYIHTQILVHLYMWIKLISMLKASYWASFETEAKCNSEVAYLLINLIQESMSKITSYSLASYHKHITGGINTAPKYYGTILKYQSRYVMPKYPLKRKFWFIYTCE